MSRLGLKAKIPVSTLLFRQISLDTNLFICRKKHETFHGCVADSIYPLDVMLDTSFGWGNGGNVTSAGWQVILCDPIWHVSSRSGEASR